MSYSGKVGASVCDAEARLSILGAVQLAQDYVSEFYGENKIDQTSMRKNHNAMWVFTKNRVKFFRPILWNEEFLVECYVSSLTSVKMVVETIFYIDKKIVLSCQIENCLVDLLTQKVRRIGDILPASFEVKTSQIEGGFTRFGAINYIPKESIEVRSTSIDYCHHTNNTEYVRFVLNTFGVKELQTNPICEFEIHYLAQTHEFDKLLLSTAIFENKKYVLITKNNEKIVECMLLQNKL